jgi:hypothetical protein
LGVLQYCKPREDLLGGNINLEIFTASLGDVFAHYRGENAPIHPLYTDPELFFTQGTYPTEALVRVVQNVFARIKGDSTAPSVQRLETAFGGGKTHTLIACLHLAREGKKLASSVGSIISDKDLPEPGTVDVVALSGEEVPVHKTRGTESLPYGLWEEMARQMGGEDLCGELAPWAGRKDSPDAAFFEKVLGGRKALIMIDELAHYAARWSVAYPDARDMVSSFLMALLGYARNHPGIGIIITLAGNTDAFANHTERLQKSLQEVSGEEMGKEQSLGVLEESTRSVASVIARDATVEVPVQANELSSVMAKRLFASIDPRGVQEALENYREFYRRNASRLPQEVQTEGYHHLMEKTYPFHPTLTKLLNHKMSTLETFQGTRGVLRLLALAVRRIWSTKKDVTMIHPCHLDFHDSRTVNEILGRTGNNDLLAVLNADIGGPDSSTLESGHSNAQMADRENPHPEKIPFHEYVWKSIFLHSLVGRTEGLKSNLFGLSEMDVMLETTFPGLSPSQVGEALKAIPSRAYYLHFQEERYYANTTPTLNVSLSQIRRGITEEQILSEIEALARKMVQKDHIFEICTDVTHPQDIPDSPKNTLALLSFRKEEIAPEEYITQRGKNLPRVHQNNVFLLMPSTAVIPSQLPRDQLHLGGEDKRQGELVSLHNLARQVLAMKKLEKKPQDYGISSDKLKEQDFSQKIKERTKALETRVIQTYSIFAFPSEKETCSFRSLQTAGGEAGRGILQQIVQILKEEKKMLFQEDLESSAIKSLGSLFWGSGDYARMEDMRKYFSSRRSWPALESSHLFEGLLRRGVERGFWCIALPPGEGEIHPPELYTPEEPLPLDWKGDSRDYHLFSPQGIQKRGWGKSKGPKKEEIEAKSREIIKNAPSLKVEEIHEQVKQWREDTPEEDFREVLRDLLRKEKLYIYEGSPDQRDTPQRFIKGDKYIIPSFEPHSVIISESEARLRGWVKDTGGESQNTVNTEDLSLILGMLHTIASKYAKGGTSTVDVLELLGMELPGGGKMELILTDVPPESLKALGELFEVLQRLVSPSSNSSGLLEIKDPQDRCPFAEFLKQKIHGGSD